ncbi:hypothetical protein BDV35DRAFT_387880 [Aspergillus flavus]|uniref:Uncharacterized protein n=1 Tax=Aspergillus flavus TaxID=5059 RepID=A0A5N6HB31_ASPFL|nr:hypothetical protein BDV35DRAFT_387880 [Aspergillus flavus]
MVASFLAAVAFAIGHGMFYQSLHGQPVLNSQPLASLKSSLHVSDQQLYISLGTFFAFLAKSSLGVSVSTTFDQFAWKSIQGERTRIDIIDDLLSVLRNGFTVANLRLWRHSPISMTLAVICWLLPVASIISPATLSVHLAPSNVYALKRIPRVDFTSANFVGFASGVVALPGEQNAWDHAAHITENVIQAINRSWTFEEGKIPHVTRYAYLSWATETDNLVDTVPFYQKNGSDTFTQRSNQLGPKPKDPEDGSAVFSTPTKPLVGGPPLSLFVTVFPRVTEYTEYDEALKNMEKTVENSTILHCMLHNASYQANLTYVNVEQTIYVTDQTVLNSIVYITGVTNVESGRLSSNTSFVRNAQVMESLSYQSIMDAFGGLLFGSITREIDFLRKPRAGIHQSLLHTEKPTTNIISTTLMETEEMRHIQSVTRSEPDSNPFLNYWPGKSVRSSTDSFPPLSKALEELFRNITISLMSSSMFQPNYTAKAVPETNVTITSYHSIYMYTRSILWAAYGTALGATALSVIAGVLVYFSNDGSYSTKFSTVFRVTQGAKVSTNLSMKDYSGLDPLPDHIAKAKMTIGYNPDYPVRVSSIVPLDQPRVLYPSGLCPSLGIHAF